MTSKDLTVETDYATVSFTQEEATEIRRITDIYSELYKKAIMIQQEIESSEKNLLGLAKDMDDLKNVEKGFFDTIATRLDLDPNTIANAAASLILSARA